MPPGIWVVRLRSPFDRQQFPSAASEALRKAARAELSQLLEKVQARSPERRTARADARPTERPAS